MKNVLVTGGTRGLGLEIARCLSGGGYRVIATGRKLSPELEELIAAGTPAGEIQFRTLDLHTGDLHEFVRNVTADFGELYGLINNAAVGHDGVLATMHESEIDELIQVNVAAPIKLSKYASRSMLLGREGRIVHIASVVANTGYSGLSVYAATKAALVGFTRSLAREIGKANITVNAILPGFMETDMTKGLDADSLKSIQRRSALKRLVAPDEVAEMVLYFLSEHTRSVTGTSVTIDAGNTA